MSVSCIIPTYNGGTKIVRTVKHCLTYSDDIIVIDDNSTDNSIEWLKKIQSPRLRILRNRNNRGASFSRNKGARHARHTRLLFIDNDCYLTKRNFERLIKHSEDIVFPRVRNSDATPYNALEKNQDYIQNSVCFLIDKTLFSRVGGFDPKITIYMDDVDFFYRCKKQSLSFREVSSAIAIHDLQKKTPESIARSFFLNAQHTVYFCLKHRRGFSDNSFPNLNTIILILRRAILNKDRLYHISLSHSPLSTIYKTVRSFVNGIALYLD